MEQACLEGDRVALGALQLRPPLHRGRQRPEDQVRAPAARESGLERRRIARRTRALERRGELLWRPLTPLPTTPSPPTPSSSSAPRATSLIRKSFRRSRAW